MKKSIKLIAVLIFLNITTFGQGINFNKSSWTKVLQKAKAENSLIMLDAYATWCGPCKMMTKNTFTDKKVGSFYNENFICVKMDMEKGEGPALSSKLELTAYPTIYYINGNGEVVHKNVGYLGIDEFISTGKKALEMFNKTKAESENNISSVTCEYCGNKNNSKSNFCSACGVKLSKTNNAKTFTDKRNKKTYKLAEIGGNTWFAENLNFKTKKSVCYENKKENCKKYGRMYTYKEAKKVCPMGFHLATESDWEALIAASGEESEAGEVLRSTDNNGFAALPGGTLAGGDMVTEDDDYFVNEGSISSFWADQKNSQKSGTTYYIWNDNSSINKSGSGFLSEKNSVRCVKDN